MNDSSNSNARAAAKEVHVIGLLRRIGALVLDSLFLSPVLLVGYIGGVALSSPARSGSMEPLRLDSILDFILGGGLPVASVLVITASLIVIYGLVFVSTLGSTPGLTLLNARIVDLYGDPPKLWRAGVRVLGALISALPMGLGFFWVGVDREKRSLHDRIAGTYVIREDRRLAPSSGRQ